MATERSTGGTGRARQTERGDQAGEKASLASYPAGRTNSDTGATTSTRPDMDTGAAPREQTRSRETTGTGSRTDDPHASGRGLMDRARQGAMNRLDSQRERAANGLTSMVDALRQSGHQLEEQNPTLASYVDTAASQLERFTGGIRDRNLSQIVSEVERFARRRPAVFLGSAFVLGIVTARFLKSSAPEDESWRSSSSWPASGGQQTTWEGTDTGGQY